MRHLHRLLICLVVLAGNVGFCPQVAAHAATGVTAWLDEAINPKAFVPGLPLTLHFSATMDAASSSMPVVTDPYLAGEFTWSHANQTLAFAPQGGFQAGMAYQVYLDPLLAALDGATFDPLPHWSLQTLSAPSLLAITPAGGLLRDLQPVIKITFDRAMDAESVSTGLSVQPVLALEQAWQKNTLEITPVEPLALGQHYQFTISGSAADERGVALGDDVRWDYWVDTFRAVNPVARARMFDISFNYPVDTQASGTPFAIEPELAGTWAWLDKDTARFTASAYPAAIPSYTLRFTAPLKNPRGGEYPPPEPVKIAPLMAVESHGPENEGQRPVALDAKIWMRFIRPVDQKSVEAAFSTQPPVEGSFAWLGTRLNFTPAKALPADTDITVRLDASVLDAAGLPLLPEDYAWTFHTDRLYTNRSKEFLSFGQYGANAQVLDAGGRRAVQYINSQKKAAAFTLYRVEPGDFAGWYQQYFEKKSYYSDTAWADTTGLEKLYVWPAAAEENIHETLLPADLPTGPYLLTLSADGETADQLMVVITRYKLVLKRSPERLWVWATDFAGNNAKDLRIRLYSEDGSIQREGQTGSDGIFATSLPADHKPALVTAMSADGDLTAAGFSSLWMDGVSDWYGWGYPRQPQLPRYYRGYVYTERPIYRPGQTMYYKAILRGDDDVHFTLPGEGTPALVRLLDARGNEVQRQELALNAFGTLNGSFTLGDGAMLGDYTLEVTLAGESFRQTFKVYEYAKPDFKLDLSLGANAYINGDEVKVEVDARYFFGQPVAGAGISGSIYRLSQKSGGRWWQDVDFQTSPVKVNDYNWWEQVQSLDAKTSDANGHVTFTFTAKTTALEDYYCRSSWRSTLQECILGIEIRAKDSSGQVVTASTAIRAYSAPVKFTLDSGAWLRRPGEEFPVAITAVDMLGQPAAGEQITLDVRTFTKRWEGVPLASYSGKTGIDGKLVLPVKFEQTGYYRLSLSNPRSDDNYHDVDDWVYVSSKARQSGASDYGDFQIEAERRQYKPYEKARLMITSSFDGPALLTFERGQVIHTRPVMLTAPLTEVEVDIIPEDAPNIFVTVNAWKGEYRTLETVLESQEGYYAIQSLRDAWFFQDDIELMVDAGANRLNVEMEADQSAYQPGQEAGLTLRVTDAQNQPVRAELSLSLVDEAIYSLSDDAAGPIFEAFYGRREHRINTYNSMALYRYLFYNSANGGGGGDDVLPLPAVRSNFQDTATWLPVVRTDANGVARVRVTLPDNLTSWRVVVKAVTAATQVGEGVTNIITQKELMLRPVLPAELVTGDSITLVSMVHNYSAQAQDVTATLDAQGLKLESPASVPLTLAAGEARPVTWKVTADTAGEVTVTMRATAGALEDAVQSVLPIRQRAMPTVASQSGDFQGEYTGVVALPPRLLPGSSVELTLSRSIGGSVLEGLEYLTGYPYGCVEQTMSAALPNAVVGRVLNRLGVEQPGLAERLPKLIDDGLQRLYANQHDDGGWGWWYDDLTNDYMTAWVVFGLAVTKEAGYPVEAQVIKRGAAYLQERLGEDGIKDPRVRAYALYSLARAGYGDREQALALLEQVYALDPFSQAALALALQSVGAQSEARQVLEILDARAQVRDGRAYWIGDKTDGHYHQMMMSSTVRTSALALSAYLQIAPDHERIPELVRYLMDQRKTDGWGSTNETAYTLLALTDYLMAVQQNEGDIAYQVLLNDAPLQEGSFTPGQGSVIITLPLEQMRGGPNLVKVLQTGQGRLYYTLTSRLLQDLPAMQASGAVQISRAYMDVKTGKPVKMVQVGQLVRVELTVKGLKDELSYVMIEDHLPAGLQAINEKLNNASHDGTNKTFDYDLWDFRTIDFFQWDKFGYNNKEIRGGRVSFFITSLQAGKVRTFTYLARATQAGTFTAMPTEFSAMYDAATWGRSASASLTITGAK